MKSLASTVRLCSVAFALTALGAGCASSQAATTAPGATAPASQVVGADVTGSRIAGLRVATGPALAAPNAKRFEALGVGSLLQSHTAGVLQQSGRWNDAGDIQAHLRIDSFRLRTKGQVFWVGAMAGADHITATVELHQHGRLIKRFKVSSATTRGGMVGAKEAGRLGIIVADLSNKIAAQL